MVLSENASLIKKHIYKHSFNIPQLIIAAIMLAFSTMVLYPFLHVLAYSLSDGQRAMVENITIIPVGFTLDNYIRAFNSSNVLNSFLVSIFRTIGGMAYSVVITSLASYAISKQALPGRRLISVFLIIPMYFTGGLLPTYVLITRYLNLQNNLLVYILPNGFWAFAMILMRSYFDTIPSSLEESAKLDGAGEMKIFLKVIIPLSMPIVAVVAMLNGVWQWNAWFDAVLYISRLELKPIQSILQMLLKENMADKMAQMQGQPQKVTVSPEGIRMAMLFITIIPITSIYPFFQKYFVKGIMIGAVKA